MNKSVILVVLGMVLSLVGTSSTTISKSTTITQSKIEASSQLLTVFSPSEVAPPNEFKVKIKLSGKKVLGVSFNLFFDPEVVKAIKVEEGDLFKNCPGTTFSAIPPEIDNGLGKIEFQDMCLGSTMSGEGVIAVIRFSAKSSGDPKINLKSVQLFDENGDPINESGIGIKNIRMKVMEIATTISTSSTIPNEANAESKQLAIIGQLIEFSARNGSWIVGILIIMGIAFYLGYSKGKGK